MKKIGIIDYFIDEWHSNKYLGLFEQANKELGLDYKVVYGWAETDKEGRLTTKEWCEKNGIERCETIEELCEKSDNILILAPANPETHLKYAQVALRYGKNTYIDKTFAPDLATAKQIFEIAEKYGTKFFTTSALRFAEEVEGFSGVESLITTGGGGNVWEYIIHQIEMAVKIMQGEKATAVQVFHRQRQTTAIVYFGEKTATLNYAHSDCGFSVDVQTKDRQSCEYRRVEKGTEFYRLITAILAFFDNDITPFDCKQTLQVIAIRDAIVKAIDMPMGTKVLI